MRGVQAEEDAAALASEGQGTSAIAGLEAGLQNLQMGMLGGIGSSYNSGAAPRVPSSGALDAHGESPIQSDTPLMPVDLALQHALSQQLCQLYYAAPAYIHCSHHPWATCVT